MDSNPTIRSGWSPLLLLIFSIILQSCSSDADIDETDLPGWLRIRIEEDERIISLDPTSWQNYGAWLRFQYKGQYFYEYNNLVSSYLFPGPYTYKGKLIDMDDSIYTDYQNKKCCKEIVWSAPGYFPDDQ